MVWSSRRVYLVHCWVPCGMMRDVLERGPFPVAVLLWPFTLHPACTRVWASQKQGFLNLRESISMLYFQPLTVFFLQPQCGGENGRDYSELDTIQVQMQMWDQSATLWSNKCFKRCVPSNVPKIFQGFCILSSYILDLHVLPKCYVHFHFSRLASFSLGV